MNVGFAKLTSFNGTVIFVRLLLQNDTLEHLRTKIMQYNEYNERKGRMRANKNANKS